MSYALMGLVALGVLLYASGHDRGKILMAVVAVVFITGGPSVFLHTVMALVPGLS